MVERTTRAWYCRARWGDLKPIYFGTVFVELHAKEETVHAEFGRVMVQHLPAGFIILDVHPGEIVIRDEA